MQFRSKKKIGRVAASATLVAIAVLAGALPASSATYVWLNKSLAPDGITYSETSAAHLFSRTGITAIIDNAAGQTWATKVWFNGYSTAGYSTASQSGPRGFGVTKVQFKYAYYQSGDKVQVRAWLLDAKLSGTGRSANLDLLESDPTDAPPVATITAEQLRGGSIEGWRLTPYGATEGGELWTAETDGYYCIFVAQDEYAASSCSTPSDAEERGVSIHALSPDHAETLQVAFSPTGGITAENAKAAGLTALSDSVAINTLAPVSGSVTTTPDAASRSQSAQSGLVVPLIRVEE